MFKKLVYVIDILYGRVILKGFKSVLESYGSLTKDPIS